MMKKILFFILFTTLPFTCFPQWKPVGGKIQTPWAADVSVENVLPEYPRPIMERSEWQNLNGEWEYAIVQKGAHIPESFAGKILVPFPVESSLSGVGKYLEAENELLYRRGFKIPNSWKKRDILLHFGAVDWQAEVWVNGIRVGKHTGGYTPFSFNITAALDHRGENEIVVRVWDPTNKGDQPRGKQKCHPSGCFYTPVSGIWQTVWLEPVEYTHIAGLKITPDIDRKLLRLQVNVEHHTSEKVAVKVFDHGNLVAEAASINGEPLVVPMPGDMKLWSPQSPFLYDLEIVLQKDGRTLDEVRSYAAMRKYSMKRDAAGIMRMELNNRPQFQFGPLDQGWWPDGLYTAPTDEALLYDIKKLKEWGFNMIRKHVKVEPARWYTHCDRLGMIVWQDMPCGDMGGAPWIRCNYFHGTEKVRTPSSEECYRKEWKEIIDYLYSYPCIGVWVPFNEAWGQFKTEDIAEWTKEYDPSRLLDAASGGNHFKCGDILDLHNYPDPKLYLYDDKRVNVVGEYGGIGWAVEGHLWIIGRHWGYVKMNSSEEVTEMYQKYADQLYRLIDKGVSAAIYTQTSDIEGEVNGLMTYDRKVIKMDEKRLKEINGRIVRSLE